MTTPGWLCQPENPPAERSASAVSRRKVLRRCTRRSSCREPTIDEVADAADVSRRTAYRYFPTHEQLLTETTLEAVRPEVERALARVRWQDDAEARLDQLVQTVQRLTLEQEHLLRSMIRLTVERRSEKGWVRGQRRVEWIEAAIEPLRDRLSPDEFERLVSALSFCLGIEAVLVLRDVRGLSARKSTEVARWAASALLHAAVQGASRPE